MRLMQGAGRRAPHAWLEAVSRRDRRISRRARFPVSWILLLDLALRSEPRRYASGPRALQSDGAPSIVEGFLVAVLSGLEPDPNWFAVRSLATVLATLPQEGRGCRG